MDESRRKSLSKPPPQWKIKIKELKKDIETFQKEVDVLLRDVPDISPNNLCIFCNKNVGCRDLPCHHILCLVCYQHHMKRKGLIICSVCQQRHYVGIAHNSDSFSSSSTDEMV